MIVYKSRGSHIRDTSSSYLWKPLDNITSLTVAHDICCIQTANVTTDARVLTRILAHIESIDRSIFKRI